MQNMEGSKLELSPDRMLRLKFNQISNDNPFTSTVSRNYSRRSSSHSQERYKVEFDKIGNLTPEQRASLVVPDYTQKKGYE